jgi:hypothetical protein
MGSKNIDTGTGRLRTRREDRGSQSEGRPVGEVERFLLCAVAGTLRSYRSITVTVMQILVVPLQLHSAPTRPRPHSPNPDA